MRRNAVACRLFHRLRSKTDDENIVCAPAQRLLSNDRIWSSWHLHEFANRCCPRNRRCISGRLQIADSCTTSITDSCTNGPQTAWKQTISLRIPSHVPYLCSVPFPVLQETNGLGRSPFRKCLDCNRRRRE